MKDTLHPGADPRAPSAVAGAGKDALDPAGDTRLGAAEQQRVPHPVRHPRLQCQEGTFSALGVRVDGGWWMVDVVWWMEC